MSLYTGLFDTAQPSGNQASSTVASSTISTSATSSSITSSSALPSSTASSTSSSAVSDTSASNTSNTSSSTSASDTASSSSSASASAAASDSSTSSLASVTSASSQSTSSTSTAARSASYVTVTYTNSAGVAQTSQSALPTASSKSNVGAIAGGTVGGVVGAIAIALGLFFLCRKGKNRDAFDDTMFNPDRPVGVDHSAPLDMSEAEEQPVRVTPFYGQYSSPSAQNEMEQQYVQAPVHSQYAYSGATHQNGAYDPNAYSGGSDVGGYNAAGLGAGGAGMAGAGAYGMYGSQSSHSDPATTSSNLGRGPSMSSAGGSSSTPMTSSDARHAKAQEAAAERNAPRINNPDLPETAEESDAPVLQHQDGGRIPDNDAEEIPPSYGSIPADRQ